MSDAEASHKLCQTGRLSFQISTGAQRCVEVFHAFLVQGIDLGDVNVDGFHH